MIERFWEALDLLMEHFLLIAAIILTVWLPGNLLINFIDYHLEDASSLASLRLAIFIETFFGPLYMGALIYALFEIKSGRSVTYRGAMAAGLQKWGQLFLARFIAGLLTLLGLLALVVPGVVLAVKFALLDSAVVIEGRKPSAAITRSTELTAGYRWQIFGSAMLFFAVLVAVIFAIYVPQRIPTLDILPVTVILDCLTDLAYSVIQILMFLFYWESSRARNNAAAAIEAAAPAPGPETPAAHP